MFRLCLLTGLMVVVGGLESFPFAAIPCEAEERDDIQPEAIGKLYGGESLEVWQERFGHLKPTSEYAALLAPGLLEIVEDREAPDVLRERAAITLGRIGKPAAAAVPVLGAILSDPNESLSNRVWAGRALGYFGKYASPAADALIDFLFDENVPLQHRPVPVEALGLIGNDHPNVLPALVRLFQFTAEESNGFSSGDATLLRELATEAFAMMKEQADLATPLLMRAARDPAEVESIRRKSVVALGQIGRGATVAIPVLIESLEFDPSEAVRDEAARALAKMGEPAHFALLRNLSHPDPMVRWRVAAALADLRSAPSSTIAGLQTASSDPDEGVRMAALESLSKLAAGRERFLPTTIRLLTSSDRQIRMRAMRLILAHRPLQPDESAALEDLLNNDQQVTARMARLVLDKLGGAVDP